MKCVKCGRKLIRCDNIDMETKMCIFCRGTDSFPTYLPLEQYVHYFKILGKKLSKNE